MSPWLALCAVGVLEACYYCSYSINDINNTIITRPFWCLTTLFLYRAIKPDSRRALGWWLLAGIAIGLGMLSKYYLGVLVICMMTIPFWIRSTRSSLTTLGPWAMTAVALLIFSPHLVWMFESDFVTVQYALERGNEEATGGWTGHLISPFKFVFSQTGAWLPIFLVTLPLISLKRIRSALGSIGTRDNFFRSYLIIVACGPILFYMLAAAVTGAKIRSMWGAPLFCLFGVLLIELSRDVNTNSFSQHDIKRTLRNCAIAATVMLVGLIGRNYAGPFFRKDFSRIHFPGQAVCEEVHRRWNDRHDQPLSIVGGQLFESGCVSVYSQRPLDVYLSLDPTASPWLDDGAINRQGAILLWDFEEHGSRPPGWLFRFKRSQLLEPFECPAQGSAADKIATVGMIYVPPMNTPPQRQASAPSMKRVR